MLQMRKLPSKLSLKHRTRAEMFDLVHEGAAWMMPQQNSSKASTMSRHDSEI